ncbi:Plasmid stabilization system protein [compost metagenome]
MEIRWNRTAIKQLLDIIQFIEENDFENYAVTVEKKILNRIRSLPETFQHHPLDRYKLNNDGTFRAFEFERYRVSFRAKTTEIRILYIRHTSRLPRKH